MAKTHRVSRVEKLLADLADYRGTTKWLRDSDLQALQGNQDITPEARDRKRREIHDRYRAEIRERAEADWDTVQRVLAEHETARRKAYAAHTPDWDYARLQWLRDEFAAKLSRTPLMGGASPVQLVAQLHDELRRNGDTHGLKALRIAAADVLADARRDPGSQNAMLSMQIARQFQVDEAAEIPAELRDFDTEAAELTRLTNEIKSEIRRSQDVFFHQEHMDSLMGGGGPGPLEAATFRPLLQTGGVLEPMQLAPIGPDEAA